MTTRTHRTLEQRLAAAEQQASLLRTKIKSQSRREDAHRKIKLGGLVIVAGVEDWDGAVIVGALMKATEILAGENGEANREYWRQEGIRRMDDREKARARKA